MSAQEELIFSFDPQQESESYQLSNSHSQLPLVHLSLPMKDTHTRFLSLGGHVTWICLWIKS